MRFAGAGALLVCALALVAGCSDAPSAPAGRPMSADAVRAFFEQDPSGRAALGLGAPTQPPFCGVDVLGGSADGRWTYAWVSCSTFTVDAGRATEASGVSMPVRLDATTRTVTQPQDGAGYGDSVRAMFPAPLAERALEQDVRVDRTPAQLRRAAERSAAGPRP